MPPVDNTPNINSTSFELVYSVKAFNKIPVHEFKSKYTGLTVVIAEVDGPLVNGFFCLATEAFDDDGLPHTLEHLIFLGSEQYPYKGILDLLANRCLASGTNAWTDVDHTCYTMETAGSEGFLSLMPIYVDHILYPTLTDEGFITEVHHITGTGEDAGVVYCEMQGCENSGESRLHLTMQRAMYPGSCGYSSNTGGIMKNLRESTTNEKVKNYHKQFYRPENLKLVITGQIKPDDVFKALGPIEHKIISKGERGSFMRPWQNPCPPLDKSQDIVIQYPADDESNGMVAVAWRGPSAVKDVYTLTACNILLKYLTDFSVAPLQKEFVEIDDPFASKIAHSMYENSEACLYLAFKNVPKEKIPLVKPKLDKILRTIFEKEDIGLERLASIINKEKLQHLSALEGSPHSSIAHLIIGQMLYGNTKEDLNQRINPLEDLDRLDKEPKTYWVNLLGKWLVNNKVISIQAMPSTKEQQRMAAEEKARIELQIAKLTEDGLKKKEKELQDAIEFNERPPSDDMLTSVSIPSIKSINFHNITRYSTSCDVRERIDLSNAPVFTYCDHLRSSFVYMFALLDTSSLSADMKLYLPLIMETFLESPIERGSELIPYEDVVSELQYETVVCGHQIGLYGLKGVRFFCGVYSSTAALALQVQPERFEKGIVWLRELLFQTKFTVERLKIIASKIVNDVTRAKRSGRGMVKYIMSSLRYVQNSNRYANGVLVQQKFLTQLIEKLESNPNDVIDTLEKIRSIVCDPANICLYFAADLDNLKANPVEQLQQFLTPELNLVGKQNSLKVTPDWTLLTPHVEDDLSHCIVGMGCLESSEFQQTTPSINKYDDPDMPALLVYAQYLIQAEGPLWKQIRGKGYAYGYSIALKVNEGLLYLAFSRATNVVNAYKEAYEIVTKQIESKNWDDILFQSAKSSLIYEFVQTEESIGSVVLNSLNTYFRGVSYEYNRKLLHSINQVTIEDLNRVGDKYMAPLFNPKSTKTAIVCDPSKSEEIAAGFKQFGIDCKVYPSIEESFLN